VLQQQVVGRLQTTTSGPDNNDDDVADFRASLRVFGMVRFIVNLTAGDGNQVINDKMFAANACLPADCQWPAVDTGMVPPDLPALTMLESRLLAVI